MDINQYKIILYEDFALAHPKVRRKMLCDEMDSLAEKKIHCFNCTGTCCTMSANSMQITPVEAFEIIVSLDLTTQDAIDLKNKLNQNIKAYRLDHEIFLGKKARHFLRKTYTCPFFSPGPKGCTLKKEIKPYGCLGFNPRIESDNGGQCQTDFNLLLKREEKESLDEIKANDYLKKEFKLTWDKYEIPKAIIALLDQLFP
jgi:hypothetical protein